MSSHDAIFVVFEGADVVGKTEQASLLLKRFDAEGIPVAGISFPRYDTITGQALGRHLRGEISVVESDDTLDSPHVAPEDTLFFEALNCLDKMAGAAVVAKFLSEERSVISSRWWQSSVIYGKDAGFDGAYLRGVYSRMPQADVNFLIETSAETCLGRRGTNRDRYERDLAKQERVRAAYRAMWSSIYGAGEGWSRIIDGEALAEAVHAQIWDQLREHSKMQRLLARHVPMSADERLARERAILEKPGNTVQMPESDARELSNCLFKRPGDPT